MSQTDIEDRGLTRLQTLNPYLTAAYEIINRFKWDIQPESWRSRSKLHRRKDEYAGQKAVILCNGPSLLKTDFELLRSSGVFTFGLNKINLLFDKTSFRPSCIVAVNPFVIEQNAQYFGETNIPLFLDTYASKYVKSRPNVIFLHSSNINKFSRDCSISIFQGYTVTFVALQLAFHMGLKSVALVGCDHSFAVEGPANKTVISGEKDESHFDPNYFAGGVKWQLPDLFQSEVSYVLAKNIYEADGRSIINATHEGKLEIFKRQSLEDFLS
jgi:hypothetical protein